jgi:uncharacterized protein (DUF1501 family)
MNRRDFLRRSGTLTAAGLAGNLDLVSLSAHAQAAADYRALVCIFLFGGNDGNNLLLPADSAGYAQYAAVRGAGSGIALTQAELLPIQPANLDTPFGLHPALKELQPLFAGGQLAAIANVGTLTQPTSKAQYAAGVRPDSLYSHSDQQNQWQTSIASGTARTGWGGRLADVKAPQAGGAFPVITSTAGVTLFVTGTASRPLAIPVTGGFGLSGYNNGPAAKARLAALNSLLAIDRGNTFVDAASAITEQAIALSATVNPILTSTTSAVAPLFAGQSSSIARQLLAVARMIEARAATGARRQIFFVSLGGFDTHANQLATQQTLFGQLSPAWKAFYDATVQLGVAQQVTSFTLSDFGRTFAGRRRHQRPVGATTAWCWVARSRAACSTDAIRRWRWPAPDDAEREDVDSHHRRGPVRRDAGEVARCLDHGPRAGVSQPGALPDLAWGSSADHVSGVTAMAQLRPQSSHRKTLRA